MIAKIFPVIIGFVSLSVPAGVVVYFIVSNLWQIGQQAVTFRRRDAQTAAEETEVLPEKPGSGANGKAGGKRVAKPSGAIPAKSGGVGPEEWWISSEGRWFAKGWRHRPRRVAHRLRRVAAEQESRDAQGQAGPTTGAGSRAAAAATGLPVDG